MEFSESNSLIDRLSASEKEREILANIKEVDDVLSHGLFEVSELYISRVLAYLSEYRNAPAVEELISFSFDRAIGEFLSGEYSLDYLAYLAKCSERVCHDLNCSFNLYGIHPAKLCFSPSDDG